MLRKEFITAHLQDLDLYGKACEEFGSADKETVLGKWYDKYCLYQEDSDTGGSWMAAANRLLMRKGLQYGEHDVTWPYSQNSKYLLIEDEKVGKDVWSQYMDDKVTVVLRPF